MYDHRVRYITPVHTRKTYSCFLSIWEEKLYPTAFSPEMSHDNGGTPPSCVTVKGNRLNITGYRKKTTQKVDILSHRSSSVIRAASRKINKRQTCDILNHAAKSKREALDPLTHNQLQCCSSFRKNSSFNKCIQFVNSSSSTFLS